MLRKRIKKGSFPYQLVEMDEISPGTIPCAPIGDVGMMDIFHLEGMSRAYVSVVTEFSFETQNGGVVCYHTPSNSSRFISVPRVPEQYAICVAVVLLAAKYHIAEVDNLLGLVRVQRCIDELFRYELTFIKNPAVVPPATNLVYRFHVVDGMEFIGTRFIEPEWIVDWEGNTPYYSRSIASSVVRLFRKLGGARARS